MVDREQKRLEDWQAKTEAEKRGPTPAGPQSAYRVGYYSGQMAPLLDCVENVGISDLAAWLKKTESARNEAWHRIANLPGAAE